MANNEGIRKKNLFWTETLFFGITCQFIPSFGSFFQDREQTNENSCPKTFESLWSLPWIAANPVFHALIEAL